MIAYGLEWHTLDTYFSFNELDAAPETPEPSMLRLYAKDDGAGVSTLCYKNDAGTEICLPSSGAFVTGTGVAGRVAIWTSASVIGSDAGLTFDTATDILTVTGGIISSDLTATRVLFAGTAGRISHDANFIYDPTVAAGIGKLKVQGEGASNNARFEIRGYGASDPGFQGARGAGTIASPTATTVDQFLVFLGGAGYNNTPALVGNKALVGLKAGENWTTTAQGTYLTLETTALLATTRTERFRVGPSGQFGIGGATFGTAGQVLTSGGASAPPTWTTPTTDHGALTGLADDDHTQYALLAGRSGGQILKGGTGVGDDLTLQSTGGIGNNDDAIIGLVGNNGGTQFFKVSVNSGFFIGNGTTPGTALAIATTGSGFAGGDWIAWFRRENTAASNESLIRHQHFSNDQVVQPVFAGLASRGTNASPVTIVSGDYLLILDGRGYDGSAVNHGEYAVGWSDTAAQIAFRAGGTWSGTDHESYINFKTTPDASITPVDRFRIASTGFIGHLGYATNPFASFVAASDADYSVVWDSYNSNSASQSAALVPRRARGSQASMSAVLNGDTLFSFQARGAYDTSNFSGTTAGVNFVTTENFSSTAQGTEIWFTITPNGTASNTIGWKVRNDGQLMNFRSANEATGAGSAALGANSPAVTNTNPYTWIKMVSSDGSQVYVPAWK